MILVDKHYAPIRRTSQQNTCADLQQRVPVRFLPIAINHSNRIIQTIRPHIAAEDTLTGGHIYVGRDEAADFGVVVAGGEIVEAGFGIVVVTAITERVVCAKCGCQGAGGGYQLAPRIVDIFYHTHAAFVHEAHYIILAVYKSRGSCLTAPVNIISPKFHVIELYFTFRQCGIKLSKTQDAA